MKRRDTILSFRSFKQSSLSNETFFAMSRMMLVLMQDMSTCTREMSSMCSPIKSRHSRTSRSIFKNSAGIKIVTAFLMSSLGPPYFMIALFANSYLSSLLSAHFYTLSYQDALFTLSLSCCFFSYSSIAKM